MFSNARGMAICIGVTGVASILLWFYFKNRIESVETKLDNMFNMIQNFAQPQSEKVANLKKPISLDSLNELINSNKLFINFKEKIENNLENKIVNAALILFPPELTKYLDKSGIKGTSDLICEIIKLFTSFKSSSIRSIIILVESLLIVLLFLL